MNRPAKLAGLLLIAGVAQGMIVLGLSLLLDVAEPNRPIEAGVAMLAVGALLAMWGCVDRLVPDAARGFTLALKITAVALLFFCVALTFYSVFAGLNDFPWPLE